MIVSLYPGDVIITKSAGSDSNLVMRKDEEYSLPNWESLRSLLLLIHQVLHKHTLEFSLGNINCETFHHIRYLNFLVFGRNYDQELDLDHLAFYLHVFVCTQLQYVIDNKNKSCLTPILDYFTSIYLIFLCVRFLLISTDFLMYCLS